MFGVGNNKPPELLTEGFKQIDGGLKAQMKKIETFVGKIEQKCLPKFILKPIQLYAYKHLLGSRRIAIALLVIAALVGAGLIIGSSFVSNSWLVMLMPALYGMTTMPLLLLSQAFENARKRAYAAYLKAFEENPIALGNKYTLSHPDDKTNTQHTFEIIKD